MDRLHIDPLKAAFAHNASKSRQKAEVSESWEDEDVESGNVTPTEAPGPSLKPVTSNDDLSPNPPPPTPISSSMSNSQDWSAEGVLAGARPGVKTSPGPGTPRSFEDDSNSERRRPEKTTATAGRMIAASLGMKVPKKTEEQRQYDRAVREQEIKRRNREKEQKEQDRAADEKAKAAVWDS
jgi:hypothetical protein